MFEPLSITLTSCSGSLTGGSIVGDIAPYQAFAIGGLGSVRGYGEGAVGSGRSCVVANSELTFPLVCSYMSVDISKFCALFPAYGSCACVECNYCVVNLNIISFKRKHRKIFLNLSTVRYGSLFQSSMHTWNWRDDRLLSLKVKTKWANWTPIWWSYCICIWLNAWKEQYLVWGAFVPVKMPFRTDFGGKI